MDRYKNIPQELKELKQWVAFKLERRSNGRVDKIPKDPHTGYNAKANDQTTWGKFDVAVNAVERFNLDGIGFEFANGIFGVDLDHVIEDGEITPQAAAIIEQLDSYTEYSPSGTGVHIICKGNIPEKDRRSGNVEMYAEGRFFTMTGKVFESRRTLNERTEEAAIVHKTYLERHRATEAPNPTQYNPNDENIVYKAMAAKNGHIFTSLWNGSMAGYTSASEADLALCNLLAYWTNGDRVQIDEYFRQSGLFRPEKWDQMHGAETYGDMTINKALSDFTPYNPANKKASTLAQAEATNKDSLQSPNPNPLYQNLGDPGSAFMSNSASAYLEHHFSSDIERFKLYKDRKTGFANLDEKTGGLYPGLYVIGAISSLGKTTFVHQLCDQLADLGDHVIFFSLEQNRLEMVTKSISRLTAKRNPFDDTKKVSAIKIRGGLVTPSVQEAITDYKQIADRVSIVECNFDININHIRQYTTEYIKATGEKPVVIVDYLQIIPPTDPRQGDKERVDHIVRGLKKLQSENDLVVFVISSINRANYLTPIDFESFKESGGIEYTADIVWGLQLQILNDSLFDSDKKIKEKREKVRQAKQAIPRRIELVCLKNRYGVSSYSCGFIYDPRFDYFTPDRGYGAEFEPVKVGGLVKG